MQTAIEVFKAADEVKSRHNATAKTKNREPLLLVFRKPSSA